ncbi:hypothetical protein ACFPL7_09070 [Dongia soli]|uniref:Uncharacterized protein n=1 Tax=Dongia soli TaxID=600628 RepID=A0ABU5EAL8_9PROT|nr:hypothetical protein [Dongia soli]MDY0883099.1 hypothetical protein [Dongia soli]
MVDFIVATLLSIGATIGGWFWDPNTHNFAVIKMGIAVVVFTLIVIFITFWPFFWWLKYFRRQRPKDIRQEQPDLLDRASSRK